MELCNVCGNPVDVNGLSNCGINPKCHRDRDTFNAQVVESKASLDLHVLARIERNEMPECFTPTRPAFVAMAQLLMESLRQNQELIARIPKH